MPNKIFIDKKKAEQFYDSLTEQEKKAMDKMNKETMKPFFEVQASMQNGLQTAFAKFIQTKKL